MKSLTKPNEVEKTIETYSAEVENIRLSYLLFVSQADLDGRNCYSLTVTAETDDEMTASTAHDITRRKHTALRIFRQITRGLVTPCTLFDVLENIL